jgi:translation elongation factor EF-1alpha
MKVKVGKVTHYFPKVEAAIIELEAGLKVGDKISIEAKDGTVVVKQAVKSMEVDRKPVKSGKSGDVIGLKVKESKVT